MKGYDVPDGYMGYLPWSDRYILFVSDADYKEYYKANLDILKGEK